MSDMGPVKADRGRRKFLRNIALGTAAGVVAQAGIQFASPGTLHAQTNLTPDAALEDLLSGNQRFAANQLTSIQHDLTVLKERTADKQEPFGVYSPVRILACRSN